MSASSLGYNEQGGEAATEQGQEATPTTAPSVPAAFGLFSSDTKKSTCGTLETNKFIRA
uniref:Uncharacterized protein n=1 Tax=Terrapene triunguis TaxID=2587831 RepID=A0A674JTX3_9SAUR